MLCRVIDGGRLVENPLMPFAALDIEITVPGATWTSEFGGDTTCPASVGNELLCGYPGGGMFTCLDVVVLLSKA